MRLRDRFWVWGHPTNCLQGHYGITERSCMSPMEGAIYLGARNVFYVPIGRPSPMEQCNRTLVSCDQVGWSIEMAAAHPENIDRVVEQAAKFPNITCGIFDDFFNTENEANNYLRYTPEVLDSMRRKMHEGGVRPLDMWMVLYTFQLPMPEVRPFVEAFDGVTLWFWTEDDVANFDARVQSFFDVTPDKRRMIGLYLYDFGNERPADADTVIYQLNRHRELLRAGKTEGVILHTNIIADLGHPAVEAARAWMQEHGDEEI